MHKAPWGGLWRHRVGRKQPAAVRPPPCSPTAERATVNSREVLLAELPRKRILAVLGKGLPAV